MPFRLKNAGATYQMLVNMFSDQIGENVEVYVDEMLVKSRATSSHVQDLGVTFEVLRWYNTKLNPLKCTFVMWSCKFMGYILSARDIEANLEKIEATRKMGIPTKTKKSREPKR